MSSDSLRFLPRVSVYVPGKGIGTIGNDQGVFTLICQKGDIVEFSSLGFRKERIRIPDTIPSTRYSVIQLMVQDTFYLPTTIIRAALTREEFKSAFLNWNIPPDKIELARRNTEAQTLAIYAETLPKDGKEHQAYYQSQQIKRSYWAGGQPPMTIFNPFAWQEFFKAWKRGDFKRKK